MARFVLRETSGKRIDAARVSGSRESMQRPLGLGVAVLDSKHCYRLCGEFHSESYAKGWGAGAVGHDGARALARSLAARLEAECATAVAA